MNLGGAHYNRGPCSHNVLLSLPREIHYNRPANVCSSSCVRRLLSVGARRECLQTWFQVIMCLNISCEFKGGLHLFVSQFTMAGQFILIYCPHTGRKREMKNDCDILQGVCPIGNTNKLMSENMALDEMAAVMTILKQDLFYSVHL